MYEPPITLIEEDWRETMIKAFDNQLADNAVEASLRYGIVVDKEELLKALRYDRGQYDKGYADGKAAVEQQIHSRWNVIGKDVMGCRKFECENCGGFDEGFRLPKFCRECGAKMDEVSE